MGKFKVKIDKSKPLEIEAPNAFEAGWIYCCKSEIYYKMLSGAHLVSVVDENGQKTKFRAKISNFGLELNDVEEEPL